MRNIINYLLPIIIFHIIFIINIINNFVLDYPLPEGPTIPLSTYFITLMMLCPHIFISFIFIPVCKDNMLRLKISTLLFLSVYIILFFIINPEGIAFCFLDSGINYWIILILLITKNFTIWNNKNLVEYTSFILNIILLAFICGTIMLYAAKCENSFWLVVYKIYLAIVIFICFVLCQFKNYSKATALNIALLFTTSSLLEIFTPLHFVLVTLLTIASIMFFLQIMITFTKQKEHSAMQY